ncbi:hypothetical protein XENORESO_017831 [Xenotaenia resolanae]|uniref:14-3-3 domain-containing protein n=1 Tax=Xenotaenia resolanae TaxID=208358 RepID=A0ABV0VN08_9TELE
MADRENLVYQAKLAEQAERYDEMVESMKKVASMDVELTVEERNLLSVAYKNVIGARRASWRIISSLEQKEENKGGEDKLKMIREYRKTVEKELKSICNDILDVLDKHLILAATTGESKVFYYKIVTLPPGPARVDPCCLFPAQEGRLPQVPGRVRHWQRQEGGGREQFGSLQSCERHRHDRTPSNAPDSSGTGP